jgi:hypothetical protein
MSSIHPSPTETHVPAAPPCGAPEQDLGALVPAIGRYAALWYHRYAGAVALEEFFDHGVDGLVYAWRTWQADRSPFAGYARKWIWTHMRNASRDSRAWTHPVRHACVPPADLVRPVTFREQEQFSIAVRWLQTMLAQHHTCLPPMARQTLQDVLADESYEGICARDGIPWTTAKKRRQSLLAWLRRHLGQGITTCDEEIARWQRSPSARAIAAGGPAHA